MNWSDCKKIRNKKRNQRPLRPDILATSNFGGANRILLLSFYLKLSLTWSIVWWLGMIHVARWWNPKNKSRSHEKLYIPNDFLDQVFNGQMSCSFESFSNDNFREYLINLITATGNCALEIFFYPTFIFLSYFYKFLWSMFY